MFNKSLSALVVSFLTVLGLLPGGKIKALDKLRFLGWLLLVLALSAAWLYNARHIIDMRLKVLTIDNLMIFTSTIIVYPINTVGLVLALSTASTRFPWLQTKYLPLPDCPFVFLLVAITFISWFRQNATSTALDQFHCKWEIATAVTEWSISAGLTLIATFVIGVCTAQYRVAIKKLSRTNIIADTIYNGEESFQAFKALKNFLSPLMFVLFVINSLIFVGYTYFVLSSKQWVMVSNFAPIFFGSFISMAYVCFVIERCFESFKSLLDILR